MNLCLWRSAFNIARASSIGLKVINQYRFRSSKFSHDKPLIGESHEMVHQMLRGQPAPEKLFAYNLPKQWTSSK